MKEMTFAILQDGGEGLVARKPSTHYQAGRTEEVLKFKSYRDQEGVVVEVDEDGCVLQLANETTIRATIPSNIPVDSLQPNDVVTFVYAGYNQSTNLPNKAKVYRRRPDLTWQEVIDSHDLQTPHQRSPNELTAKAFTELTKQQSAVPYGHWTMEENKNIRVFFDTLARSLAFDPLIAENWYHVTRKYVLSQKGGSSIVAHYKGSYMHAVADVYPELKLDERRFAVMPRYYWHNPKNRKSFLNSFAKSREFDPLVAENWYNITKDSILNEKSGRSFLLYFRGSLLAALSDVYPRVRFDELMFERNFANYWQSETNRKEFFDRFAKANGFDPLAAANWHSVSRSTILRTKSGGTVLKFYGGSMVQALLKLYPDIGLEKRQFATTRNYWQDPNHRREYFNKLAEKKGFDPLIPENWYSISKETIANEKFGGAVIYHYGDSIVKALLDLYPTIGLKAHKFSFMAKSYWNNEKNRRAFFDALAVKQGFDPLVPSNWYSLPVSRVTAEKSGSSVLYHHDGSYAKALKQLYPNIGLEDDKLYASTPPVWTEKHNRREFFVSLAAKMGFDPLIADNWYSFRNEIIVNEPSGGSILHNYYAGSLVRALVDVFPDVQFQISEFNHTPKNFWNTPANRRQFFDYFAYKNGFDPLDPLKWYQLTKKIVVQEKNYPKVVAFHNNSFVTALIDLYPSIGLQEENFDYIIRDFSVATRRKRFMLDFALKNSFDPLVGSNWHRFCPSDISVEKNGRSVMKYYNGNLHEAISDLFPLPRQNLFQGDHRRK